MKLKEEDCDALTHAADSCMSAARKLLEIVMLRNAEKHFEALTLVRIEEARGSMNFASTLISDFEKRKLK